MGEPPATRRRPPLWKVGRHDAIADEWEPGPVGELTAGESLLSLRDEAAYDKALAEELAQLVCSTGDEWITRGVMRRMGVWSLGRPYVTDLSGRLLAVCPDLIAKLDADDQRFLARQAAKAAAPAPP